MSPFQPGQTVVCRVMWQGKIREERPEIVIRDTPDLLALYLHPNTVIRKPVSPAGEKASYRDFLDLTWSLSEANWIGLPRLRLSIPGAFYSVLLFWNNDDNALKAWYINLEEPLYRTPDGFDYIDLFLDIIASPDLSEWHWEDEEELEEAVNRGFVSRETSEMLYREGRRAVTWLQSGDSPFIGWGDWHPGPNRDIPVLPEI